MNMRKFLKKSVVVTLGASMLITSVPAKASVSDSQSYKIFYVRDRDEIEHNVNDIKEANIAAWNSVVFKKASLDKKEYKAGDKVKIKITIDDSKMKETGDKYYLDGEWDSVFNMTLTFKSALSEQEMSISLDDYLDGKRNKDGTITYTDSFTIKDGMKRGNWIISEIEINDTQDGPCTVLKNRNYTGDDRYPDLSWGDFKVIGTKADLQAPALKNFKVKKLGGDCRITYWAITDKSKAECVRVRDIMLADGSYDETILDKKNGLYSAKWNAKRKDKIYYEVRDILGNYRIINLSKKDYVEPRFNLENSKIEVKKVTVAQKSVTSKQTDKITLNMKWTKFTPKYVMLEYRAPYGSARKCVMMKADNKSKTKWTGKLNFDNTSHNGIWRLYSIHIKGKNSKGKTITTEVNNSASVTSQLPTKSYLKSDLTSADIKVK